MNTNTVNEKNLENDAKTLNEYESPLIKVYEIHAHPVLSGSDIIGGDGGDREGDEPGDRTSLTKDWL